MAIIKCKMCGGDLTIEAELSVAKCEYCGSRQTVPNADNEKKLNLFSRANRLRSVCEFDKASGVYESIVAEFPEEAEAYWGLVLCKYGIEYVDDPASGNKVPTCHRSSYDSIFSDSDFEQACENADAIARRVYRDEAKRIEEIRKGIIAVSGKEEPYDIFICYKETDESGKRTIDSVIAQDVYDSLSDKGYRVFFSRITLEDKLGQEYEPYIFAALNSAKIMLVFGTDYEYFNAVWVKNEWSRFLKLMATDKNRYIIPCYKSIDAYDMPQEFSKLQAQDMGKVGAIQDLIRGIEKIFPKNTKSNIAQTYGGTGIEPLLRRGNLFLEDKDWENADSYFEKVLDLNPECAEAYLGKMMTELHLSRREEIATTTSIFENDKNYQKAIRFGSAELQAELKGYCYALRERLEQEQIEKEKYYKEKAAELAKKRLKIAVVSNTIAANSLHTIGLKTNGTVIATKYIGEYFRGQCAVDDWTDIVAVMLGEWHHALGLKSDGTVITTRESDATKCDIDDWTDIVAVSAGRFHTVGLKSDGTVVATSLNESTNDFGQFDVSDWNDIIAVSTGDYHTIGLKSDGTVVGTKINKAEYDHGQCDVSNWKNIVAISAGYYYTVGLKSDGTVIATGNNDAGQCDVSDWTDIVAISAGCSHTVGLKSDGTVVATKYLDEYLDDEFVQYCGQCDVDGWNDIIAISAGEDHTVGLKSDGTVLAVGDNDGGQCNVSGWKLFENLETVAQERAKIKS